jgi:hypothetical protein
MNTKCASCGTDNDAADRFCKQCGTAIAEAPSCRSCGARMAPGSKFCTDCGTAVAAPPEIPQGPGYVVDGEWHRAPGEMVRLVPGDALRSAFGKVLGVDWAGFLRGTLAGKVLDALLARSIRVPMGSVGALVRDGRVVKVLPPGAQTTPALLRDALRNELSSASAEVIERLLAPRALSLYLIDRRPIPVSFSTDQPAPTGIRTLHATALIAVGAQPDALTAFLTDVLGERDTLSSEDLYLRFRGEIERGVGDALRANPKDVAAAERAARTMLRSRFGARTGLEFDLVLAPRHTVHRLDLKLGGAVSAEVACPACGAGVRPGQRFCTGCGETQPSVEVPDGLYTADGASIELDVALSLQGDQAPAPPQGVLLAAASRWLRERPWAQVRTEDGMKALEEALGGAGGDALAALGSRLLQLELVDARSTGDQWLLGARSQIAQARSEVAVGREWLAVRDDQLVIEELSATVAAKAERIGRDAAFAARSAALEDARRTAEIEAGERELARQRAEAEHGDAMAGDVRGHERVAQGAQHRAELDRQRAGLDSELNRQRAEDEAHTERLRREARLAELAGMTELDAQIADREQRHRMERMGALAGQSEGQMLAMQAADLAGAEHGAAFAEALGKLADGEAARRERDRADEASKAAVEAMRDLARTSIEANAKVAAAKAGAPAVTVCPGCGATLSQGAKFCGGCGTATV